MKKNGVVVLLSLVTATLAIVSHIPAGESTMDCMELETSIPALNDSLCSYAKQFPLSKDYFVVVCTYLGKVKIGVRRFIRARPTIQGYFLAQWNHLKRLVPRIDVAIAEASTCTNRETE